jgi:hypothetical protein
MVLKYRSHGIIQKRFGVCKYRRLNSTHPQVLLVYQGYGKDDVIQVTDTIQNSARINTW